MGEREEQKKETPPGKRYLEEMKELDNLIRRLKIQIELENNMLTDTAVHYKDIQVQSSGAKDLIGDKMPEITALKEEICKYIQQLAWKKKQALTLIKKMESRRQQLIILYYMQNKTLERTAKEMGKSYTWTWTEMQNALTDFEILFQKAKKIKSV